jgi:hypothetical protein
LPRIWVLTVLLGFGAVARAQEPEHRPVRPKGRYFTQDQLHRALAGANQEGMKSPEKSPSQPLSENAKSLIDFAKKNPELAKSLIDAARDLAKNNPDLFRGGNNEEAAKKIAEQLSNQSNLGDMLKNLKRDQKPPPSNVKRPTDESDEKGRRQFNRDSKRTDPTQTPRREDSPDDPNARKEHDPRSERKESKNAKSTLNDLAGENPDFTRSLLEELKKKAVEGTPPTPEAAKEAVDKIVKDFEKNPTSAPWLNDPMTQEKIQSPALQEEVRREMARRSSSSNRLSPDREKRSTESSPPRNGEGEPSRDEGEPKASKDGDRRPNDATNGKKPSKMEPPRKFQNPFAKKNGEREADRKSSEELSKQSDKNDDAAAEKRPDPKSNPIADMLKENPGLVDSLINAAKNNDDKSRGGNPQEGLKGIMEALKGTGLEKDFRDLARELNKDGSLNDLLKNDGGAGSAERTPRRTGSAEAQKTAREEAAKALKELTGEGFDPNSLGGAVKSLGEAFKKSSTPNEDASRPRSEPAAPRPASEGLGEGWIGALGRGASKVGEWGAKASQKLSENVAPEFGSSRMNPPSFGELKSLSLPSAESGGKALMVFAILAAVAVGVWMILKRNGVIVAGAPLLSRLPKLSLAGLSPREQAAALFERAALERLGEPARPRHHVALAEKLCQGASEDSRTLADVYEAARYTPPTEPFQADNVGLVKDVLGRHVRPTKNATP